MAATYSKMVPLGTKAIDFNLYNPILDKFQSLQELKSEIATVIMFICNHCPFVKFINKALVELTNEYLERGISFIAINSNDVVNYPEDSPQKMIEYSKELGYNFPYLFDETQEVAKAYDAACTPDFYIYDKDLKLVYRGQFDDSRPSNGIIPTGKDIRKALDLLIENKTIDFEQKPSIGCNIKWKNN
jgi:thiol-disulfide isomerase/thioredoxin